MHKTSENVTKKIYFNKNIFFLWWLGENMTGKEEWGFTQGRSYEFGGSALEVKRGP